MDLLYGAIALIFLLFLWFYFSSEDAPVSGCPSNKPTCTTGDPVCGSDNKWSCPTKTCDDDPPTCKDGSTPSCASGTWKCPTVTVCDGTAPECLGDLAASCKNGRWFCPNCTKAKPACGSGSAACQNGEYVCDYYALDSNLYPPNPYGAQRVYYNGKQDAIDHCTTAGTDCGWGSFNSDGSSMTSNYGVTNNNMDTYFRIGTTDGLSSLFKPIYNTDSSPTFYDPVSSTVENSPYDCEQKCFASNCYAYTFDNSSKLCSVFALGAPSGVQTGRLLKQYPSN